MGVQLRALGTTATYAPVMKRAAHRLSSGRSVVVVPDTNRSDANGADVTGTAKIHLYLSTDSTRTAFALNQSYTPAVAPSSSTKAFVGSSTTGENDDLYVVYQGTDNSLRLIFFDWNGTTYLAGAEQTIIAANAVTDRFRAVDCDKSPTDANLAVIVYESNASSGQGAWARVYIRLNDGTTWIKASEHQFFTTQFIRANTPDVSIACDRGGPSSNIMKYAIYYNRVHTVGDDGDLLREYQFNVSTGTTNSATSLGNWYTNLNQNIASSFHRGFIFPEANARYVFGTVVGTTQPKFQSMRIQSGIYTGIVINQTSTSVQAYRRIVVRGDVNPATPVGADYCDGRLLFAYSGLGYSSSNYKMRMLVFRYDPSDFTNKTSTVDQDSRHADGAFSFMDGVIGTYGGGTKYNMSSQYSFNFAGMYGTAGNTVSAVPGDLPRIMRSFTEDTFSAPVLLGPVSNPSVDTPILRAEFRNVSPFSNILGKMHWQLATDFGFTSNVKDIVQPDTAYFSYSGFTGNDQPTRVINYEWPVSVAQLFGNQSWHIRVRVDDDLGGFSPWSIQDSFFLEHPPTALPTSPATGPRATRYTTGDTFFAWNFSDTEPTDSQTAYQIVIVRTDTGATVHDTGKIASSTSSAWIDISGTLRNVPLQWQVAVWDEDDIQGPFSNASLFTLLDKPLINITAPADAVTLTTALPTVTWAFSADASRTQRAYRVTVYDLNTVPPSVVGDSGWIASSETSYSFPANILDNNGDYRFVVDVLDSSGLSSSTSDNILANPSFDGDARGWVAGGGTIARSEAVVHNGTGSLLLDPTGGVAATATADFVPIKVGLDYESSAWVYMPAGYAGNVAMKIIRYDSAGTPTGTSSTSFGPITASTWTQITRNATTVAGDAYAAVQIEISGTPLTTDIMYIDDVVLQQEQVEVDTVWTPPALGDGVLTQDDFRVFVNWTDANLDADFVAWRVYRRYMRVADSSIDFYDTANLWELVYEIADNSAAVEFQDFLAPLNKEVEYVVVQLVDRFGSLLESNISSFQTIQTGGNRYFFVPEVPIGAVASFEATSVNADNFVREVEQAKLRIMLRGRQVQVGDDLGYDGSLTIRLRSIETARRDREFFEFLSTADAPNTFVKSPFGDVICVKIGQVSSNRIAGVGTTDMVDMSVPYSQVLTDAPITRVS